MLETASGTNNIFRQIEHIQISDIHYQAHGYFGMIGIKNVGDYALTDPLIVSNIQILNDNPQQVQNLYVNMNPDMIYKTIKGSIKNISIKKLRINWREYDWNDTGGLIRNDITTIIYLLFKTIKPSTRIGVYNLKYEIEKSTLANFGNNVKELPDEMSSNYSIIIDKGEPQKDCVRHIFRDISSGPNSTFNHLIESTKDYWDTGR